MILAYVLNFAHELQPHEHHLEECCGTIFSSVFEHVSTNHHEHHSSDSGTSEHQEKHNDHCLPFPHSHLHQSHTIVQIRNLQTSVVILDISEKCDNIYIFQPPELLQIEINQPKEKNFYQTFIASSLGMRAPPDFS